MAKQRKPNQRRDKRANKSNKKEPINIEKKTAPKVRTTEINEPLSFFNNSRLHLILIFALSFVLYINTISHDYALDDSIVIIDNEFTKKGFEGIGDILKYDTFRGFFGKDKNLVAGGRYRPLSLVTFAVEWQFFGKSPAISHFINILLYGLAGMVLYLLLLKMFNPHQDRKQLIAYFIALASAVLFIAHPIHTEAVANIKGRDEIMALLGSLTALYWSFQYFYSGKIKYLIGTTIVFFLALMSKENSITFLAIAPLALYFFTQENKIAQISINTLPYLAMAILFLVIRSSVLGASASIGEEASELMNNPFLNLNANERYGTIFYTLGKYIQLLVVPHPLTHDYYPRQIPTMTFGDWQVILSVLLYVGMGIYALLKLPKKDPIAFGIIFYLASLSIVSNLLFSVGTNMSERLVFMPSVGFVLIIAVLLSRLLKENTKIKTGLIAIGVITLLFSAKTIIRNPAWQDNYTLFSTDIKTSTNSAKLNNAMGGVTIEEAVKPENSNKKVILLNEAIGYLTTATKVHPSYGNAYLLMGNAFFHQENYGKAVEFYQYTIQQFDNPNGKNNLFEAGKKLVEKKDYKKAIPILEEAKSYLANNIEIYGNLGAAYGQTQQHQKAIDNFKKVIELDPKNVKAHRFIGYAYMNLSASDPSLRTIGQQYIDTAAQLEQQ